MSKRRSALLERSFWSLHSHTWDDLLQREEHRERLAERVDLLRRHLPEGARMVDAGCGTGNYALALADAGYDVVGLDFSHAMLKKAREKAERRSSDRGSVSFRHADLTKRLPFDDASLDAALCAAVLQCLPDPAALVREVARVLKPGGLFEVVAVGSYGPGGGEKQPIRTGLLGRAFWTFKKIVKRRNRWPVLSKDQLMALLRPAGFEPLDERRSTGSLTLLARLTTA